MIELQPCTDTAEWDRYLRGQPRATVFHRSDWLALVARLARARLHAFVITRAGEPVGLLPIFLLRQGPFRIAATPPAQAATPYLSPLVDDALLGETLNALTLKAGELKASYLELRFDRVVSESVLDAVQMRCERRGTYVLSLDGGPDALWKDSLSSTCRRAIRKAQNSSVAIDEVALADIVDRYYALSESVFAKSNRPPPLSRADYAAMADLQKAGCVKVFAARVDGVVAAAGIFPYDGDCIYYLDGVSDPETQQMRPNNLLHWEVIRWACEAGLRRYDMVGAGIPGVARFKQGFGPTEIPYTYAHRSLSPFARMARGAYARLAPAARQVRYSLSRIGLGGGRKARD